VLRDVLDGAPPQLVYVDYLDADGSTVFEHACRMPLEAFNSRIPGEVVAIDHNGPPDFAALQVALSEAEGNDFVATARAEAG
jgi:hypothetical protein